MTITFENDNDVIVYALEKIISYSRKHQYIFVAQSVWWLASITGLTEGLIVHMDTLKKRTDIIEHGVSTIPRDAEEELRFDNTLSPIHPDRIQTIISTAEAESEHDKRADRILDSAELFLDCSIQEKKHSIKDPLHRTRAVRVDNLPQSKNQWEKARKAARLEKSTK